MSPAVRMLWFGGSVAVTAFLVFIWQMIANYSGIPPVFLPGPDRAWNALTAGFASGELLHLTWATVERMLLGWLLASFIGIALGALIGSSRRAREYIGPTLELVRPIPVSAFMPVMMAFLGLSGRMVTVVIALGAIWSVLLATVHGVSNVEPRLAEVAKALRFGRLQFLWKFALPNAQTDILAGMRLGLTVALILAVVGEMLASEVGLGQHILNAARAYRSAELFAGVMLLGLVGLVSNLTLQAVEWRVLRWRRR